MRASTVLAAALGAVACGGGGDAVEATAPAPVPLSLEVSEPPQAAHVSLEPLELVGHQSGLVDLTLNGAPLDAPGGDFATTLDVVRGINAFEVTGLNAEATLRRTVRQSVLAGRFGEAAGSVDEAMGLRLNRGGLAAAADLAEGYLDPVALTQAVAAANPVYDSWVATINVGEMRFGTPRLTLEPGDGALDVSLVLPDVWLWLPSDIALLGYEDVWVTCDEARIEGSLGVGTDGRGHLALDLIWATVALNGFEYDTSILDGDTLALFDGTIQGVLEDELLLQMETLLPDLMTEQLSALELAFDLDLLGTPAHIGSSFRYASVDRDGVQLIADLEVDVDANGTKLAPGYLLADAARPTPDTGSDLSVALSDDLINRLLFEVWASGLLDQTLSTADGSLDIALLSAFGANDEASIVLDAQLPPVLVQHGDETLLQIGELTVRVNTPGGDTFDTLDVALSASIPVDLEVEGGELVIALGRPELDFIVRDTDWQATPEQITALLEDELPIETLVLLLGKLSFPLPSLAGFTLDNAAIARDDTQVFTQIAVDF